MSLLFWVAGGQFSTPIIIGGLALTVGAPVYDHRFGTLSVRATANGRDTMNCEIVSTDSSFRPGLDQEVIMTLDGVRIFGGFIARLMEKGLTDKTTAGITTEISATDYNKLADERVVYVIGPEGQTLKWWLQNVIIGNLSEVTLAAAQEDGPILPALSYDHIRVSDVLDEFSALTGYTWEIDYFRQLQMTEPGTVSAPFDITEANLKAIGDVTVEPTREQYANRVIVWNGTIAIQQVDDLAEQTAFGRVVELAILAADGTTADAALAMAQGALLRATASQKVVRYRTRDVGLHPGQTQTINLPARNINNIFLITDVETYELSPTELTRSVTAMEGTVYRTGWRQTYRNWTGAATTAGAVGGGSGGASQRFAYALASGVDAVSSPIPDWVPASAMVVQLNTVARGTQLATVIVRLRALNAGVSVRARLFDVTNNVACAGTSSLVTDTNFQLVSFTSTVTAGSNLVRLELLPSAANEPCVAAGYLE